MFVFLRAIRTFLGAKPRNGVKNGGHSLYYVPLQQYWKTFSRPWHGFDAYFSKKVKREFEWNIGQTEVERKKETLKRFLRKRGSGGGWMLRPFFQNNFRLN